MMAREVGNVIFKAITIEVKLPYKAFSVSAQLKQKKTIVEEVYGWSSSIQEIYLYTHIKKDANTNTQ